MPSWRFIAPQSHSVSQSAFVPIWCSSTHPGSYFEQSGKRSLCKRSPIALVGVFQIHVDHQVARDLLEVAAQGLYRYRFGQVEAGSGRKSGSPVCGALEQEVSSSSTLMAWAARTREMSRMIPG